MLVAMNTYRFDRWALRLGIPILPRTVLGKRVIVAQLVTIGGKSRAKELPVIEDDVYVGPGARVLGPVRVGKGSVIGANAVVVKDVPAHCVVGGVPAKILHENINRDDFV